MDYAIRFLATLLKWMVIVAVVVFLCAGGFLTAMNISHIYILVSDGMAMRVGVSIGYNEEEELPKFFNYETINADTIYQRRAEYEDYDMESFVSEVSIESIDTAPWRDDAVVILTQSVPFVTGYLPISKQTQEQLADPNKIPAPAWDKEARYELTLEKVEDKWMITSLTELDAPAT